MNRVIFIVDGFNLYHSVKEASGEHGFIQTKWLNLHALCQSFLPLINPEATLESIYYFTSLAEYLGDPNVIIRHNTYMECLEATGVIISKGRFKPKQILCPLCRKEFTRYEKKETDIAVASKLLEVFVKDECDTAVLMTGDTDAIPAVKTANSLYPHKVVLFAFPYNRKNRELAQLAPRSFRIKAERYIKYQFSNPFQLPGGKLVYKPESW
jgi:uncharacterized LabA/DUF88 family protein